MKCRRLWPERGVCRSRKWGWVIIGDETNAHLGRYNIDVKMRPYSNTTPNTKVYEGCAIHVIS